MLFKYLKKCKTNVFMWKDIYFFEKMEKQQTMNCCLLLMTYLQVGALPMCNYINFNHQIVLCNPSNSTDYRLKRGFISDNNNIEVITLSRCKITDLDRDSLQNLYSLKYLDLSENNLQGLELGVFNGTPSLIHLNISKNYINALPADSFVNISDLLVLDLKENTVEILDLGLFDPLEKLQILDLSWNNFLGSHLHPLLFKNNIHITYISFSGNDMNETPEGLLQSIQSLETLNLDGCVLDEVPAFATKSNLKTMKELILSSNQIYELINETIFTNLESLEVLNLDNNEVKYIEALALTPLKKLKVIILKRNELTYLPDDLFDNLQFLRQIDLSHNKLASVSVSTFHHTPVKILDLSFNRFTYLKQNFCGILRKLGANLTELYFHQNPWQCACLKDVLTEVGDLNLVYKTDIPGYGKPVCVTTRDARCHRDDMFNSIYTDIYDKIKLIAKTQTKGFFLKQN